MKFAIVTMKVKSGKCEENYESMESRILQAIEEKVDLIVFSELSISGCYVGDLWKDSNFCEYVSAFHEKLINYSYKIAIAFGSIKYRKQKLFNVGYFMYQGKVSMRSKGIEKNPMRSQSYFQPHNMYSEIEFQGKKIHLSFDEIDETADLNIIFAAKPLDLHAETTFKNHTIFVNCVGMQNENKAVMMMEGGSYYYSTKLHYQAPYGKEDFVILDTQYLEEVQPKNRLLWDLLVACIRDFDQQVLHCACPWIIGLSGGIDSSVSLALLQDALGSDRIYAYGLSSSYNSSKTKDNAKKLAERLQVPFLEGSIVPLVDVTEKTVLSFENTEVEGLVKENIQARIRGHLLSTFAALHRGVVVNNGNKVEYALGYCTLYGDAIGALSVIGDLTKVQLFSLAKEYNEKQKAEIIPYNLYPQVNERFEWEVMPSAELNKKQKDPMKWFYHDYLVDNLDVKFTLQEWIKMYENHKIDDETVKKAMKYYGLDNQQAFYEDLIWFCQTADKNAFKHFQSPPILTVTRNAYSLRKEVQGIMTRSLKEAIYDFKN